MVSVLDSRPSTLGSNISQGHCVVFLGHIFHSAELFSLHRCINGYSPRDGLQSSPIQGVLKLLLVVSCYVYGIPALP